MRQFKQLSLFFMLFLLAGLVCACQQIGQYSVSEQVINSALQKKLGLYNQSINAGDLLKLNLDFNSLTLDIGNEVANKVMANGSARVLVTTPLGEERADIKLRLKVIPEINKQQDAIFLKQVEIADYQVNSSLGSISSSILLPYLNQALQLYFDNNPIYQLDKSNQLDYLAFKSASNISIEQGKLVFSTW